MIINNSFAPTQKHQLLKHQNGLCGAVHLRGVHYRVFNLGCCKWGGIPDILQMSYFYMKNFMNIERYYIWKK